MFESCYLLGITENGKRFAFCIGPPCPNTHFKEVLSKGSLVRRNNSSSDMISINIIGSVASIVGLILAIVFRVQDIKGHKTKESNRQRNRVAFFL